MRTPSQRPNSRPGKLPRTLALLLALLAAATLISCKPHSVATGRANSGEVNSVHWVQVKSNPPTFFPQGVPADHPTGYWNGIWVRTEDEHGTRYFIPVQAANGKALIENAVAAISPQRRARMDCVSREAGYGGTAERLEAALGGLSGLTFLGRHMKN